MKMSDTTAVKQWFAVYTRSRCEKKVAQNLAKKNIEHYCPLNKVVHQWSDRKKVVLEPLFASYIFVRVAEGEHTMIKQVDGVVNMVHWLGKPAVIRDQEIEMIRSFLDEHSNVKLNKLPVNVDDSIRVLSGPLMEQQGKVLCVNNNTVKVSLPSLGYVISAEVKKSNIEVVSKSRLA